MQISPLAAQACYTHAHKTKKIKAGIVKYTDRVYEFPHRVNTSNLSNGVYIIRVVYDGKTYSSRLLIDN